MQFYSSATTLGAPSKPVEIKIPYYFADGTTVANLPNSPSSGTWFLADGASGATNAKGSNTNLHTLSAKWPASTNFAFEATLFAYTASYTMYAALYDMTSNAIVSASQVSTSSSTATVLRSGQFTLTPGHVYGVTIWDNSVSSSTIIDASLIVFPS